MVIGSDVTPVKAAGPVSFKNGKTTIEAEEVELQPGTEIELGTEFEIKPTKE